MTFAEEDAFPTTICPVPPHDTEDQLEIEETQSECAAVSAPLMQTNVISSSNETNQDYSVLDVM